MSILIYKEWKQCSKCFYLTPKYISESCHSCNLPWGPEFVTTNEVQFELAKSFSKEFGKCSVRS